MTTVSFRDSRRRLDAVISNAESFANSYVLIGFQEGSVTTSQVKGRRRKEAGKSMAQIAAENEFGTRTTPARPFMRTSFDENREVLNNVITGEYEKILGGASTVKRSLNLIGRFGVELIKQKIRDIRFPPNSRRTIAIKKSSKPLIDFGQMIQSVQQKVIIS